MEVSISSILRTFKTDIIFLQPIYEAIANSFDANARNIQIVFNKQANIFDFNYVDSIDVIDDGEGFTNDNLNSFLKYMSEYKLNIGGKGVGRFTWLKVFKNIKIESQTLNEYVEIDFSAAFDNKKNVYKKAESSEITKTKISFKNIIQNKHNTYEINLLTIKKQILDYFMLKFIEFKNSHNDFCIDLVFNDLTEKITLNDISSLNKERFSLKSSLTDETYDFELNYSFIENIIQTKNECFLCGNGRTVENYDLKKMFSSLPQNKFIKVLIYSKYFDERINDERTSFTFSKNENNPTIGNPIPFSEISNIIDEKLDKIILNEFPSISDENKKVIKECLGEKPYLSKYIMNDDSIIKRKKDILDKAQKEFEKEKENVKNNFVKILDNKNLDYNVLLKEFDRMNELSNRELAQYFLFRQVIIDSLKKMNDDDEKIEKYLHTLFSEMGIGSGGSDPLYERYKNCIWLLDDKYMSYDRFYSDTKISKIKKEIMNESDAYHDGLEPDLTIFYSNHDVVVVEFKGIGANSDDKLTAYTEINRNLSVIAKNFEEINNIYGYVITKFDNKFMDYISEQPNIKALFSNGNNPIYYLYNDNIKDASGNRKNAYVYFISTDSIYFDANSRNKLFVDIIKNK